MTTPADLAQRVRAYVDEYEFRGDTDYTPNGNERALIEDAILGFLADAPPVPVVLHCPVCKAQHVDEIDPVNNPGWENPPHVSHKCLSCGAVWRPSDYPTEGVRSAVTRGRTDVWP